jgi:hypothetical protein
MFYQSDPRLAPINELEPKWIRGCCGIYRLARFPVAGRPDLVRWSLLSRNRNKEIEGVSSHDTALRPYELASEGLDTNQGVLV